MRPMVKTGAAPDQRQPRPRTLRSLVRSFRWVTHPITIFVSLQIVWLAITLIWVIWFVGQQEAIADLAQKFGQEFFDSRTSLAILVVGCILLGVLLVGLISLFVVGQRESHAARQQRIFVSSVTHELKSPLASLQLSFETMTVHDLNEATKAKMMDMVQSDLNRLRRLVDQILLAGRLDRGLMFDEESTITSARVAVERALHNLRHLDKDLVSRVEMIGRGDLEVAAPRGTLDLILTNIIENAIKYSPRRSPIQIKIEPRAQWLQFAITDRGLGFVSKDKRRMFGMFHRGDTAIKKAIPGTGLGLYIVKNAVTSLGGQVWAESPGAGQGSTFFIQLPYEGRPHT